MYSVLSSAQTDVGRKRSNNEDSVASYEPDDDHELTHSGCLYIVADGVGGALKGERASQYACEKVLFDYYQHADIPPADRLAQAMRTAGRDINNFVL